MKLHVFPRSPRALEVRALVNHLNLDVEECLVDLFKGEQQAPAYAALNPNKRMPVLEDGDFVLWESNAILQYLAAKTPDSGLWPSDARGQADAGLGEPNPAEIARGEQLFHPLAAVLNGHLRGRKWRVGRTLTIAELALGGALALAEAGQIPLEKYDEIVRWYDGFRVLAAWQKSLIPPQS